jgi:hypothetical protein
MSKILSILVATIGLGAGAAWAQTQSTTPTVDPGTKLNFAPTVGGATFERVVNYAGPPANRPDQGSSYFYTTPKKMIITVQVFDGGRHVPPGSTSPTVVNEFTNEIATAEEQIKNSGYTNFQRPSVSSNCVYGSQSFRCITYSAMTQANQRVYSKVLLTGYQNHFIKVRIDWGQMQQVTSTDADAALQAFIPALLH